MYICYPKSEQIVELVRLRKRFPCKFTFSLPPRLSPRFREIVLRSLSSRARIINRILLSVGTSVISPNRFLSATGARTIATDDYRISVSLALPHRVLHLHPFRATFRLSCDDPLPTTPSIFVAVTT